MWDVLGDGKKKELMVVEVVSDTPNSFDGGFAIFSIQPIGSNHEMVIEPFFSRVEVASYEIISPTTRNKTITVSWRMDTHSHDYIWAVVSPFYEKLDKVSFTCKFHHN